MMRWGLLPGLLMALAGAAVAAKPGVEVRVVDAEGAPVQGAVVSLHAVAGGVEASVVDAPRVEAVIEQVGGEFNPGLLVVTTGTPVRFPNLDRIRHHVYSFSPAKVFELPLYSGEAHEPVVFDATGVVTLGCNIHDWMLGHVVVLDTPLHAVSDAAGIAMVRAPPGTWQLRVWHARLAVGEAPLQRDVALQGGTTRVDVSVDLSTPVPRRRPGQAGQAAGAGRP